MKRFPIKRRLPGLRLLAFGVVSLLGAALAFVVPVFLIGLFVWLLRVIDLIDTPLVVLTLPLGLGSFLVLTNELGKMSDRALRLRAKWGELAVGLDGIAWDDWIGRKFLPWKDIAETRQEPDAVWLELASGRSVPLMVDDPEAVEEAIDDAKAHADAATRAAVPASLEPSTNAAQWITSARELARESYRGGVPEDVLVRVVEDPNATPLARAGAALALAETKEAMPRMRVVVDELADEELRHAMEEAVGARITPKRVAALARRR